MQGSCLCGTVQYEVKPPFLLFQYCHCSRCQKVTGSAHASNLFAKAEQFQWIAGEDQLQQYKVPETKYYTSTFCKHCGSPMPSLVEAFGNYFIPAGSLDDNPEIKPQQNIFWADHACWYEDTNNLPKHDAYPIKK